VTAARDRLAEALRSRGVWWAQDTDGPLDALLPVVAEIADEQAAKAVELAALIVENATGIGSVSDEQLGQLAQSIREIPQYRARAAALAPDNGGPQ